MGEGPDRQATSTRPVVCAQLERAVLAEGGKEGVSEQSTSWSRSYQVNHAILEVQQDGVAARGCAQQNGRGEPAL